MNKLLLIVSILFSCSVSLCRAQEQPVYKMKAIAIEKRVEDLLERMTLEEKIVQIRHIHSGQIFNKQELDLDKLANISKGMSWGFVEGFPLTGENCGRNMRLIQKYMIEETRLGIPIFTTTESLHGSTHEGSTIFPQNIALGSTFNVELAYLRAKMISSDLHVQGMRQVLAPCIDVVRDLRWGRVEESYSEDPILNGMFAIAEVKGYLDNGISPMLKHYGPHGNPLGGLNLASVECGLRDLHDIYLKPFEMVIKETPIQAIMSTYNSWNRIPNSASRYLLTKVLREQWAFTGYVYSDWGAISMLQSFHRTAANRGEAAIQAITAGLDVEASSSCYPELISLINEGKFDIEVINESVRRVLYAKFKMGLFDDPYNEKYDTCIMHSPESILLSKIIADESTVLLKNENNLLPLDVNKIKSLAVIGPNADQVQFGDYTWSRNNEDGVTPLKGLRNLLGNKVTLNYAEGCSMMSMNTDLIAEAVEVARKSDIAIIFCGSSSASLARDYSNTNSREGFDLSDLNLPGAQGILIQEVYKTGTPVILILVSGKPFSIKWEKENIPAILVQWYAGEQAGNSIAEILFGKVNPSGKLTYSFPQSVGHLPAYYNYLPSDKGYYRNPGSYEKPGRDYVFSSPAALWSFGYGLSYTNFTFDKMYTDKKNYAETDTIKINVQITNIGDREGKEVIQIYIRDLVSSVVTPVKQLRAFEKINLSAGEYKEISLSVPIGELYITTETGERFVEHGEFEIQVGNASDNILLRDTIWVGEQITESKNLNTEKPIVIKVGKKLKIKGEVRDVQATLINDVEITSSITGKVIGRTNAKGDYVIETAENDILIFSKKGYITQRTFVNKQKTINIKLDK